MRPASRNQATHEAHDLHLLAHPMLWAVAVAGTLAVSSTAHAATTSPDELNAPSDAVSMTPRQAYEHDRAFCNSGEATEARSLCLKEAARAYHDDRAGKLVRPDETEALGRGDRNRANASGTGTDSDSRWNNDSDNHRQSDRTQDQNQDRNQDRNQDQSQSQGQDSSGQ